MDEGAVDADSKSIIPTSEVLGSLELGIFLLAIRGVVHLSNGLITAAFTCPAPDVSVCMILTISSSVSAESNEFILTELPKVVCKVAVERVRCDAQSEDDNEMHGNIGLESSCK